MSETGRHQNPAETSASRVWTRRDLLVRGGQTIVAAGLATGAAVYLHDPKGDAGLQPPEPIRLKDYFAKVKPDYPASAARLSVAYGDPERIADLTHILALVEAAVAGLDRDLGISRFISRGDVVLLKPNVGFDRDPRLGATTNPLVVQAVIQLCRKAKAGRIIVADNPIESPGACFARSGIAAAAGAEGATVIIYSSAHERAVEIRPGRPEPARNEALGTWPIFWKPLREADKVIGLPVIKDHNLSSASMTMKNWYGLLSGRRNQFHQAIHDIISDLGYMMKPTLIVADGTRVMMRNGPTGGRLDDVQVGGVTGRPTIVAGVDQVACDAWCYQNLLGRDPNDPRSPLTYVDLAYRKFGQDPGRIVAKHWKDYDRQGLITETKL
ncbi:MAG: DUF362 domain-containing protein [Phycisphaerae bacterium]